jgi:FeS assembly SUF system regulator
MIKVSRLADYAVVVLATLSAPQEEWMTASAVSVKTRLPEPTVAKVLKLLAKAELATSLRGAAGGYKAAHTAKDISIADIVKAVDGPISLTACVEGSNEPCGYACSCPVKGRWDKVNLAIRTALEEVSLADMISNTASPAQAGALKIPAYAGKAEESA